MSAPNTLRRLVIGGDLYRWRVAHAHLVVPAPAPDRSRGCCEVFTAVLEGRRAAALIVRFPDGRHQHAGYPQKGVVWTPALEVNLNLPSTARRLIQLARAAGWRPEEDGHKVLEIADGFSLLPALARGRRRGATT